MKKILGIIILSLLMSGNAYALTAKDYLEHRNGSKMQVEALKTYVQGVWQGIFWFHINHEFLGGKKRFNKENPTVFCFPENGKIIGTGMEFIDAEILYQKQQDLFFDSFNVETMMLQYLNRTFPCK